MTDYWHTGVCDCTNDCASCCITYWCPCVQYGLNNEKIENGSCCLCGLVYCVLIPCSCCTTWYQRNKVRAKYGIVGGACSDALLSFFCGPCLLCQISRELDFQLTHPKESNTVVYVENSYVPPTAGAGSATYPGAPVPAVPAQATPTVYSGAPAPAPAPMSSNLQQNFSASEIPESAQERQAINPTSYGNDSAILH